MLFDLYMWALQNLRHTDFLKSIRFMQNLSEVKDRRCYSLKEHQIGVLIALLRQFELPLHEGQ